MDSGRWESRWLGRGELGPCRGYGGSSLTAGEYEDVLKAGSMEKANVKSRCSKSCPKGHDFLAQRLAQQGIVTWSHERSAGLNQPTGRQESRTPAPGQNLKPLP